MLLRRKNIFLEHTWLVVIVVVVLAGPLDLLLDRRTFRCPMSYIYIDGLSDVFFAFLQELAIFNSFFNSSFIDFHLFWVEFIKSSRILAFNWVVLGFDPVPVLRWVSQYLLDLIQLVLADRSMQCYKHIDRFLLLVGTCCIHILNCCYYVDQMVRNLA